MSQNKEVRRIFGIGLIFGLHLTLCVQAAGLNELEKYWGLSPLKESFQHRFEGVRQKGKSLEVSSWYEDASITQNALPQRELFCRFLHAFTYGKNAPRANRSELPPSMAFRSFPDISEIDFLFFAVIHHNEPSSPYWDKKPNAPTATNPDSKEDPNSKLRVVWTREERIVPYLSLKVSKQEWSTVSRLLKDRKYYAFTEFNNEVCDSLFRLLPRLRSNFAGLDAAVKNP